MTLGEWISVVKDAVARHGSPLTDEEIRALLTPYVPGDPLNALSGRTLEPVMREIFARGREGRTFGDLRRLEDDILYGSVESAFPGASQTFLNLNRAFLTFWKEYRDIAHIEPRVALQVLLRGYIGEYTKRFFPTADLRAAVPYMLFANEQREALAVFGNGIDIDDFFRSNPLLIHTANPLKGSGCLFVMGVALGGPASLFACWCIFA
jgi:hypothetical protein